MHAGAFGQQCSSGHHCRMSHDLLCQKFAWLPDSTTHGRVHTAEYMFTISLTLLDIADHALQVFELQPSYMDDLTQSAPPLAHNVHAVYQTCHTIVKQLASVSTAATLNGLSGVCRMICSCHQ